MHSAVITSLNTLVGCIIDTRHSRLANTRRAEGVGGVWGGGGAYKQEKETHRWQKSSQGAQRRTSFVPLACGLCACGNGARRLSGACLVLSCERFCA